MLIRLGVRAVPIVTLALTLAACRLYYIPYVTPPLPAAIATLADANGRTVGQAVFIQYRRGVRVLIDVTGLEPGSRGVHIHEIGRCDPPSFESAGGHFNPTKAQHGTANRRGPHAGDLPNLTIEPGGKGHLEATATRVRLDKGANSLLDADGSAVVIHERADDLTTDPDGNSGARVICGVVVAAGR